MAKVWKTRVEHQQLELKFKGLLPIDRQILQQVGLNLTLPGAVEYRFQVATMTAIDAHIMLARTKCTATTAVAKSVALRISDD